MERSLKILISVIVFTSVFLNIAFIFRFIWKKQSLTRNFFINLSLCCYTIVCTILASEYFFSTYIYNSDGFGHTLAMKQWMKKYWIPKNSMGFRDVEHNHRALLQRNKKVLFVVGDSIVAGHGIKNYQDRFPNILQKQLGEQWEVIILARNGWQTKQEYRAISTYPIKPDVVILSYYINDIHGAASLLGYNIPIQVEPSKLAIVKKSYFVNYLYWRLYRGSMGTNYWDYLSDCFNNQKIWQLHTKELLRVIGYMNDNNIPLIFVVWPHLMHLEESIEFTSKVVRLLNAYNVPALNVSEFIKSIEARDRIVNPLDVHPNESIHMLVATKILEEFRLFFR